jgi:threonyl-tRNA synthetase
MSSRIELLANWRRRTIQRAEQMKVHTMFVIGKRDMEASAISVRLHGKGNLVAISRSEATAEILQSIRERRT